MTEQDLQAVIRGVAPVLKELIAAAVTPLRTEVELLRAKEPRDGMQGLPGQSGRDGAKGDPGEPGAVGPMGPQGPEGPIGPQGPAGEKGADGLNGKDGADGLNGKDGKDGIDGKDGADGLHGKDGAPGIDGKDADETAILARLLADTQPHLAKLAEALFGDAETRLGALVVSEVASAVKALPVPKDGSAGVNGKDGNGIAEAFVTDEGALVLTMTDGTTKSAGKVKGEKGADGQPGVPGRNGEKGADGKDGLGFDDIDVDFDEDTATMTLKFKRGDRSKTFGAFRLPIMRYREVWSEGQTYRKGDVVTWAGSGWICKVDATTAKPGSGSPDWQLMIKKGSDGKDRR